MRSIDSLLEAVPELRKRLVEALERHPRELLRMLESTLPGIDPRATEEVKYRSAEQATYAIYPKFRFSEFGRIFLEDEGFIRDYQQFMDPDNWHSLDRKFTLDQLLGSVIDLPGDVAECGVWKGATAFHMCKRMLGSAKTLHLFDSFEGLSEPGAVDGTYWRKGALSAPEDAVHATLKGFKNYRVYRGWIPTKFNELADSKFCFVHVDVDIFEPTLYSLEFFFPRLVSGGVLLMDDYGFTSCPGAKRAADQFFGRLHLPIVMLTTGQAMVTKR